MTEFDLDLAVYRLEALYKEAMIDCPEKMRTYYQGKIDALQDVKTWAKKFSKL